MAMKKMNTILAMAAVVLAMTLIVSCEKEIRESEKTAGEQTVTPAGKQITITATIPDTPETRVAFEQETGNVKLTWEAGDKIIIVDEANLMDKQTFTLSSGAGEATATFSGTAPSNPSSTYTIFYAGNSEAYTTTDAVNNKSYADQVQVGNGNTDHLAFTAMLTGVNAYDHFVFSADWASAHSGNLVVNSIYKFYFKLPAAVTSVSEVRLNAPAAIFYTTNSNGSTTSEIGVSLSGVDVSASEQVLTAYAMASDETVSMAAATYTVTVVGTSSSWVKQFTTASAGTFGGGKTHVIQLNDSNWAELPGKGTESAPFLLDTPEEFQMISPLLVINGAKRYFKLSNNIDFTGVADYTAQEFFNGELDGDNTAASGKGYSITNLTSSQPLFGKIDADGSIKNLTIASSCNYQFTHSPKNEALYCGALGKTLSGTVTNITVNASVSLDDSESGTTGLVDLGGLIGRANAAGATISNCSFNGTLTFPTTCSTAGEVRLGGIVGCITEKNPAVQVSNCSFTGVIDCKGGCTHAGYDNPKVSIGGIVGKSSRGAISSCSTTDADEASKVSITIGETEYKASIAIHPAEKYLAVAVGGIVGCSMDNTSRSCSISACNNYSSILTYIPSSNVENAYLHAGGIVGNSGGKTTVTSCYNYGPATHISTSTTQCLGGDIGYDKGAITKSYNQNGGAITVLGTAADLRVGGVIGDKAGGTVTANSSNAIRNRGAINVTAKNASTVAKIGGVFGNNTVAISGTSTGADKDITNNAIITVNQDVVTSNNWAVGGVVGYSSANLTDISNNGGSLTVTGKHNDATAGTGSSKNISVGGVLGLAETNITISNCKNAVKVTYQKDNSEAATNACPCYVGGIVGKMTAGGTISSCVNSAGISNGNYNNTTTFADGGTFGGGIVGALVGTSAKPGSIVKCEKTGSSTTDNKIYCYAKRGYLGAIAGYVSYTTIGSDDVADACTSESFVYGVTKAWCGGLVGMMVHSSLKNSTFTGSITNTNQKTLGGIVYSMDGNSAVSDCTFNGSLSYSSTGTAGFVAYVAKSGDNISNCKIAGSYNGTAITSADITNAKICASGSPTISGCSLYSE